MTPDREVPDPGHSADPVVARRERFRMIVAALKRLGYVALTIAIVAFGVGVASGFPTWSVTVTIVGLVLTCVVLPIPIVLDYGIRKAEREDPLGPAGPSARARG
jgi:hypothetical protein